MAHRLVFVRLVDGRLWHVRLGWATACGRDPSIVDAGEKQPEELQGVVPTGAWVCTRCRAALADWLAAVDQAIKADPRTRRTDPLPDADVIDAEIVQDDEPAGYPRITEGRYIDSEPTDQREDHLS